MAVTANFRVDIRPYSGYSDPSLPIASWVAQGGIAGDASGGTIFMNFLFQRDEDAQISELFNLEQIAFDTSTEAVVDVQLDTRNMDTLAPNRPLTDQRWMFSTDGVAATGSSALRLDQSLLLPIWLGSPNRVEGESGLRFQTNNIDLLLLLATLQGYMWGPRSVLANGGPRRPVGGLFGT